MIARLSLWLVILMSSDDASMVLPDLRVDLVVEQRGEGGVPVPVVILHGRRDINITLSWLDIHTVPDDILVGEVEALPE